MIHPIPERRTSMQRTADRLLPEGLDEFVTSRRAGEQPRSWRLLARDLLAATDGLVDVSPETLRGWYGERVSA